MFSIDTPQISDQTEPVANRYQRGNQMQFALAGVLITLGVFQLIDLQKTNPQAGYSLTFIVLGMWAYLIWQTWRAKGK